MAGQPVRIGSRDMPVEQSPIRTTFYRSHNPFFLGRPSECCLVIQYHRGIRALAWIFCLLGWPVLAAGLLGVIGLFIQPEPANFVGTALLLLWGGGLGLMGVWLLGPRCRFDSGLGQLTIRHCWRTRRRPLADIVAVQVIAAGKFESGNREGLGSGQHAVFESYQLNLVLDDPKRPRQFVAYNEDLTDMARKASVLARFLHVPVVAESNVQAIIGVYERHDSAPPAREAHARRFSGSDHLPRVRHRDLAEPYRSWIDRAQPLPARVQLLPRTVQLGFEVVVFLTLGGTFMAMCALIGLMFWPPIAGEVGRGEWKTGAIVLAIALALAIVPFVLLRRACTTVGALRDQQRGRLRQGIFVGSEGVLVRMEPNRCYPIPLDRFMNAKTKDSLDSNSASLFVIETLDGTVDFFSYRLTVPPEHLVCCVDAIRKRRGM